MNARPIDDLCGSFAELLGLETPIPPPALQAIADDPSYARRLFACRGAPEMMALMLAHPPEPPIPQSPTALVASAAAALARWAGSGFARVEAAQAAARLAACRACPHLAPARGAIHKLAGTAAADTRVCRLCGCVVGRKVGMATEHCPAEHPDDPALSRWGEPLRPRRHLEGQEESLAT